jgi:hypothetical protein
MSTFKQLDSLFPVGKDRKAGEVVSVTVFVRVLGANHQKMDVPIALSWKRKAWYKDASTNAFLLHRQLSRQLRECFNELKVEVDTARFRELTAILRRAVYFSYIANFVTGTQYFEYSLHVGVQNLIFHGLVPWNPTATSAASLSKEREQMFVELFLTGKMSNEVISELAKEHGNHYNV